MLISIRPSRIKWVLLWLAIIAFLFSIAQTITEARYLIFGKHAAAQVTKEAQGENNWSIKYSFTDTDGKERLEGDYGSGTLEERSQVGDTIDVQFIPGSDDSRLAWHSRMLWTIPCLASVAALTFVTWRFTREYREHALRERLRE